MKNRELEKNIKQELDMHDKTMRMKQHSKSKSVKEDGAESAFDETITNQDNEDIKLFYLFFELNV